MAAVYKSLSKGNGEAPKERPAKNKQRVLILSSRGVTYRYASTIYTATSILIACLPLISDIVIS